MDLAELRTTLSSSVEDFIKKHGFHINNKVDLNVQDDLGRTPVFYAVQSGNLKVVEFLIDIKVDLNIRDNAGMTPIFYVILPPDNINEGFSSADEYDTCKDMVCVKEESESNNVAMLKLLLSKGAAVDFSDFAKRETVLHKAAKKGYTDVVQVLLEFKADVNSQAEDYSTPISLSAANGHLETCMVLLEHGASLNVGTRNTETPLHLACKNNHLRVVKCLLDADADVNAQVSYSGHTALHYAAEAGYNEIVEFLLAHGALVNGGARITETPLHLACENNHLWVVQCLLDADADVNAQVSYCGYTALHYAAEAGSNEIVELLLAHGALVNGGARITDTPLHLACKNNHLWVVQCLLEAKADVNVEDYFSGSGYTALHYAAEVGSNDIVELLLEHGASANGGAPITETPLHLACENNHLSVVKCLMEADADVNAQYWDSGYTPLHFAAKASFASMVELLLDNGALVNAKSKNGCTPLHIACEFKHFNVIKLLLERGAQVDLENDRNKTALDLACSCGFANIAELLLKFDAKPNIPNAKNAKVRSSLLLSEEFIDVLLSYGAALAVAPPSSRALTRHMVKLKISNNAGLHYPSSFPLEVLKASEYALDCEEEISRMMSEKIGESNLSFFNILACDVHKVAVWTKNLEVMRVFEEENIDDIYPIYGEELRRRFQNGVERSELLKEAVDSFHSVCLELPEEICEKILGYLRHKDLVALNRIKA